jgi:hypothetical protein
MMYEIWEGDLFITCTSSRPIAERYMEAGFRVVPVGE